jgi:hypothetical protein
MMVIAALKQRVPAPLPESQRPEPPNLIALGEQQPRRVETMSNQQFDDEAYKLAQVAGAMASRFGDDAEDLARAALDLVEACDKMLATRKEEKHKDER